MTFFASLFLGTASLFVSPPPGQAADVEAMCEAVPEQYAYFEARRAHWAAACDLARLEVAEGKETALSVLEGLVDALYEPHANLGVNNGASPRLVPSGLDIRLARLADGRVVIAGLRPGTSAGRAGLSLGDEVIRIHGLAPVEAARRRIRVGEETLPGRMDWALNAAMAGYRDEPRSVTVRKARKELTLELGTPEPEPVEGPVTARWLKDEIGYIRLENSLGDSTTVPVFLETLAEFREARGLVLDLRNTPGGGNTSVAEPMLAAFLRERTAYQMTVEPGEVPSPRFAGPAGGAAFSPPVVVLVGYWTGSMGEGLAIGFDATGAGRVMGSRMARLAGGTEGISLPGSGIGFWIPVYDLTHVDGTQRHHWAPSPSQPADFGDGEDRLLERAVQQLMEEK